MVCVQPFTASVDFPTRYERHIHPTVNIFETWAISSPFEEEPPTDHTCACIYEKHTMRRLSLVCHIVLVQHRQSTVSKFGTNQHVWIALFMRLNSTEPLHARPRSITYQYDSWAYLGSDCRLRGRYECLQSQGFCRSGCTVANRENTRGEALFHEII